MSANGDCFVVLPSKSIDNCLIIGRNSIDESAVGVAQEVCYYDANEAMEGETDGGAKPIIECDKLRVILQKPKPGMWGGDFGANERNVTITISWSSQLGDVVGDCLHCTDIVRITLAHAETALKSVELIGAITSSCNADDAKFNIIACDPNEAWLISCAGKAWASKKLKDSLNRLPSDGLAVSTDFDICNEGFDKTANFAETFNAVPTVASDWSGAGDEISYKQATMFDILRTNADSKTRSACVSVLSNQRISCHWFTATPNAKESVFKPFVFSPNPKISPLTKVPTDAEVTLLHKLHAQRNADSLDDLLALEAACIKELNNYLEEHPTADDELDELMKDCVEAEVKFYR